MGQIPDYKSTLMKLSVKLILSALCPITFVLAQQASASLNYADPTIGGQSLKHKRIRMLLNTWYGNSLFSTPKGGLATSVVFLIGFHTFT